MASKEMIEKENQHKQLNMHNIQLYTTRLKVPSISRTNGTRRAGLAMLPRPSILGWAWLLTWPALAGAGLLGAGEGEGSCAAPPFRAHYVKWPHGCPAFAPCCTEYGFCRPLVSATRGRGSPVSS